MCNNFLISIKVQLSLLCILLFLCARVVALTVQDKSLAKLSQYSRFHILNSTGISLAIDRKKTVFIFKQKNQSLTVRRKNKELSIIYTKFSNKYIENVYIKNTSRKVSLVKYEKYNAQQYFFSQQEVNCGYQSIQKINFDNLQSIIDKVNIDNLFDKKSCSDIEKNSMNDMQNVIVENLGASNFYLKQCLNNVSFQKYLETNENFSLNILGVLQSFEQNIFNLKNGEKSFEIKCEENNNKGNRYASVQLSDGITKLSIYKKKNEFEILKNNAAAIMNHEFFHMGSQKQNIDGTHLCVEEANAKLFTEICNKIVYETAGKFDLSKENLQSDLEIFIQCKNNQTSVKNNLSFKRVEAEANTALPKVAAETETALTENARAANAQAEQRVAMSPEPQRLVEVVNNGLVDQVISNLPTDSVGSTERSVASIPGLSDLANAASAAMASIGSAIADNSTAAAGAVVAAGVAIRRAGSNDSVPVAYSTASLAADVFNSGLPIPGYFANTNRQDNINSTANNDSTAKLSPSNETMSFTAGSTNSQNTSKRSAGGVDSTDSVQNIEKASNKRPTTENKNLSTVNTTSIKPANRRIASLPRTEAPKKK